MRELKQEDAVALVEAILEGKEPTYAHIVREIRQESNLDLRTSAMYARVVLRKLNDKGNKMAFEILQRLEG